MNTNRDHEVTDANLSGVDLGADDSMSNTLASNSLVSQRKRSSINFQTLAADNSTQLTTSSNNDLMNASLNSISSSATSALVSIVCFSIFYNLSLFVC